MLTALSTTALVLVSIAVVAPLVSIILMVMAPLSTDLLRKSHFGRRVRRLVYLVRTSFHRDRQRRSPSQKEN
jgi:hypothetical protein